MYCLSGPVVGALVSTHGCRPVCVAGAVLASLGLAAGSFAPSLSILIWCYRYKVASYWSTDKMEASHWSIKRHSIHNTLYTVW